MFVLSSVKVFSIWRRARDGELESLRCSHMDLERYESQWRVAVEGKTWENM